MKLDLVKVMKMPVITSSITHLFLDIGGVLLTNGWDHDARKQAATNFNIEYVDLENRHRLVFENYEKGGLTLEEYLNQVIFYQSRPFTREQFQTFIFAQSKPYPEMIEWVGRLKAQHAFKIIVVSNEARELNEYRIQKFKLDNFVDSFICSCYVHMRKPDTEMFRLALDVSHAKADNVVYIEDLEPSVRIAESLGIRSILHKDYETTRTQLVSMGVSDA